MSVKKLVDKVNFHRHVAISNGHIQNYFHYIQNDIDYIAKTIYHSSHIEGNTVSYADTLSLISGAMTVTEQYHKYSIKEKFEVVGLHDAVFYMYQCVGRPLSEDYIKMLHYYVYRHIEEVEHNGVFSGEYRMYPSFTKHKTTGLVKNFLSHHLISREMENLVYIYNNSNKSLYDIAYLILDFIHIHPFGDGNGRVSRLLLNWALLSNGYVPIIIRESDRREYIDSLHEYGDTDNPDRFVKFISKYLLEAYRQII